MKQGFTLLELMIVVAIIACLSMLSVPRLMKILAKAKRSEAYVYLRTIAQAQKIYFAEQGSYSSSLKEIGWSPEGAFNYTYGLPGTQEGEGCFVGKLGTSSSQLRGGITKEGFIVSAAGTIYGEVPDIVTINQDGEIVIVQDGLM